MEREAGDGGVSRQTAQLVREVVAFSFSDANINSGVVSNGWLDISASSGPAGLEVRINRLIFDDASTTAPSGVAYTDSDYPKWEGTAVPEPS